jgi:hypothetical protein
MTIAAQFEGIEAMLGQDVFGGRESGEGALPWMPGERAGKDVLNGRGIPGEVQLLEDQADATAEMAGVMETPMLATVGDGSHMPRVHPGKCLEQRGFPRARRAYHRNKAASRHRHVEVTDQDASPALHGEPLDTNMGRVDRGGDWIVRVQEC